MYADWHASMAKTRKSSRLTPKIVSFRKYNRCSHPSIHPYSSTYPYQGVRYELGWSKPICLLISLRGLQEYFFSLYGGHSRGCLWMLQFESILAFFSYFPSIGFLTASFPLKTLLLMPWRTMGDAFPRSCDGSMLHFSAFCILHAMLIYGNFLGIISLGHILLLQKYNCIPIKLSYLWDFHTFN